MDGAVVRRRIEKRPAVSRPTERARRADPYPLAETLFRLDIPFLINGFHDHLVPFCSIGEGLTPHVRQAIGEMPQRVTGGRATSAADRWSRRVEAAASETPCGACASAGSGSDWAWAYTWASRSRCSSACSRSPCWRSIRRCSVPKKSTARSQRSVTAGAAQRPEQCALAHRASQNTLNRP